VNIRILSAVAVILVTGSGCNLQPNSYTFPGQKAVGDDGYTLTVGFEKVENLVPNSNVQLDNVTIGTVTKIKVDRDWNAQVTLRISDDQPLPKGTRFAIGQKTLLGAQYVEVTRPVAASGTTLRGGDVVSLDRSGTYPSTEQVLGAASLLLNNGGLSQISTITEQLTTALHGRVPNTRELVSRLDTLVSVLDANKQDIVTALEALSRLSTDLRHNQSVLGRAIDRITPGLRALNAERGRLVNAVTRTGMVSVDAGRLVDVNERALLANLRSLRPILARLGTAAGALPDALKIGLTIPFPAMTTSDAIRGDYANLFATLDLSGISLASLWLGSGGSETLTSGNPLAPLTAAPNAGTQTKPKSGTPKSPSGPATESPSPAPAASAAPCTLLLSLLGGCS
jgi:phospholipid/cholesterol/gamma-HCH transport system substrate-binding protein